jgi:negative regulator of flagellin synthesis FlgM
MADPIRGVTPPEVSGIASPGGSRSPAGGTPKPQAAAVPAVDSADLSRAEALLTSISQTSATVSAVDLTRVSQLQEMLNSGTYRADPQLIAQKIMEIESLLSSDNPE